MASSRFAQVASWQKAERDWVDGYLNFKGRIERDDWVKQADALAKGGVAEYIRVFGKKPVWAAGDVALAAPERLKGEPIGAGWQAPASPAHAQDRLHRGIRCPLRVTR